jgi:hypothetical protein
MDRTFVGYLLRATCPECGKIFSHICEDETLDTSAFCAHCDAEIKRVGRTFPTKIAAIYENTIIIFDQKFKVKRR